MNDIERLDRISYIIDKSCMDEVDLIKFLELTTEDIIAIMPDVLLQHEHKFLLLHQEVGEEDESE